MDDRKMKIKIVVRPEDPRKADAAAENRQWMRQRGRWALAALLGVVALSAAIAFFVIGRGTVPIIPEERPVASAPAASKGLGSDQASPSAAARAAPAAEAGDSDTSAAPGAGTAGAGSGGRVAAEESAPLAFPASGVPAAVEPSAPADAPGGEALTPWTAVAPILAPERPPPAAPAEGTKARVVAKVPAKPEMGVIRAQLASRVVSREPVDTLQSPVAVAEGGRDVYYFNEFRNLSGQTVIHRWEYNGRLVAAIPFRIEGNRWRVYSSKRIGENQRGDWRVSTVDKAGAVRARAHFRVE